MALSAKPPPDPAHPLVDDLKDVRGHITLGKGFGHEAEERGDELVHVRPLAEDDAAHLQKLLRLQIDKSDKDTGESQGKGDGGALPDSRG